MRYRQENHQGRQQRDRRWRLSGLLVHLVSSPSPHASFGECAVTWVAHRPHVRHTTPVPGASRVRESRTREPGERSL
jgi:hypothetical protein